MELDIVKEFRELSLSKDLVLGFDLNAFVGGSLIRLYAAVVATIMHDVCLIKCLEKIILSGIFC